MTANSSLDRSAKSVFRNSIGSFDILGGRAATPAWTEARDRVSREP